MNKPSGGDGIPAELFAILKENNRIGKTRDQENLEISSEHFMHEWA